MAHKRDGERRAIGEKITKSQKITARLTRELYGVFGEYPFDLDFREKLISGP